MDRLIIKIGYKTEKMEIAKIREEKISCETSKEGEKNLMSYEKARYAL